MRRLLPHPATWLFLLVAAVGLWEGHPFPGLMILGLAVFCEVIDRVADYRIARINTEASQR